MESVLTHHDLIEVANGAIPDGKFDKIWSDRALTPLPPPPDDASWSDNLRYRQHLDDIEKRKAHNETVLAQRRTFWRDKTNLLFEILTASMIRTAPGLRDTLRAKYGGGDQECVPCMKHDVLGNVHGGCVALTRASGRAAHR